MPDPFLGAELGADIPEVDVHGMRSREAEDAVERLLQGAFMRGDRIVRIIHGHGAGILAAAVRKKLTDHPNVRAFRVAGGVTFAEIERKAA